jgi:hypothetical protein
MVTGKHMAAAYPPLQWESTYGGNIVEREFSWIRTQQI